VLHFENTHQLKGQLKSCIDSSPMSGSRDIKSTSNLLTRVWKNFVI